MKPYFSLAALATILAMPVQAQPGIGVQGGASVNGQATGPAGSNPTSQAGARTGAQVDITQPGASDLSTDKTNVNRRTTNQEMRDEAVKRDEENQHKRKRGTGATERRRGELKSETELDVRTRGSLPTSRPEARQ